MITGDSEAVARAVAEELGLDDYFAEVLPNDKAEEDPRACASRAWSWRWSVTASTTPRRWPKRTWASPSAPAPTWRWRRPTSCWSTPIRATCCTSISLSRSTYRKMVQNLWWASGYNIVAIPLAAGVAAPLGIILPPAVGAIVMSVSTVIVAINSRLLTHRIRIR